MSSLISDLMPDGYRAGTCAVAGRSGTFQPIISLLDLASINCTSNGFERFLFFAFQPHPLGNVD